LLGPPGRAGATMNLWSHLRISCIGFLMGMADLVPGVSGGTIAFVCGIYDRLVEGLKRFDLRALDLLRRRDWAGLWAHVPWTFFVALGTGLLLAVFSLARALRWTIRHHPEPLWAFFFGLVLGSIVLLVCRTWRWRAGEGVLFALAAAVTFQVVGLPVMQLPPTLPFVFVAGAIAICAMILPGISGSYLLVILGQYSTVLAAVAERDVVTLGVFVLGIAVGLLSFVRVVSWLLHRHRRPTLVALIGVMAGALRTVWPWRETLETTVDRRGEVVPLREVNVLPEPGAALWVALALALLGAVAVLVLERLAPREQR
jgi:putative membrane protein